MSTTLKQPLTNVQLELLKAFSHNLKESELIELKKAIALFLLKNLSKRQMKHGLIMNGIKIN